MMTCGNTLYSALYREAHTARKMEKKEPKTYGAELFLTEEEETGKKRGKQSVFDDAKAAGKDSGAPQPKTETESRIVVKPDGTRVLIITVRCGQSVRMKTLKLCDKADMENEAKQDGASGQEAAMIGEKSLGKDSVGYPSMGENSVENSGGILSSGTLALAGETV